MSAQFSQPHPCGLYAPIAVVTPLETLAPFLSPFSVLSKIVESDSRGPRANSSSALLPVAMTPKGNGFEHCARHRDIEFALPEGGVDAIPDEAQAGGRAVRSILLL